MCERWYRLLYWTISCWNEGIIRSVSDWLKNVPICHVIYIPFSSSVVEWMILLVLINWMNKMIPTQLISRTIHAESLNDTIKSNGIFRPRLKQQYYVQIQFPECHHIENDHCKSYSICSKLTHSKHWIRLFLRSAIFIHCCTILSIIFRIHFSLL